MAPLKFSMKPSFTFIQFKVRNLLEEKAGRAYNMMDSDLLAQEWYSSFKILLKGKAKNPLKESV